MKQPLLSDPQPELATKEPAKTIVDPKFQNQITEEIIFQANPERQEKEKDHKWFGHHLFDFFDDHHHHHGGHKDVYITAPSYAIPTYGYGVPQGYAAPGYAAPGYYGTYMAPAYVAPSYNQQPTYQPTYYYPQYHNHHQNGGWGYY